ncbi:MAG: zinc ribbon domain-containing protein [Candidatus Marsarchaeota archaeon]|nr:zinc ribbon domain-containing protein [Candidatus Marsarchaeota archaeon]
MTLNIKKIGELFESNAVELFCPYCGTETYCLVSLSLCSNCESIVSMTKYAAVKKDSALVQSLRSIKVITATHHASEEEFEIAIKVYDELISSKGGIGYIYAKALLLINYSNYVLSRVNYETRGFMEENYAYSQKSMQLVSSARLLFYKLISIADSNLKSNINSFNDAYFAFLAYIKLGRLKPAQEALGRLKNFNDEHISSYAGLVFDINMMDFGSSLAVSEKLLNSGAIHPNIIFYRALALFRMNKFRQSKKILDILQDYIKNENINNLKEDIVIKSALY